MGWEENLEHRASDMSENFKRKGFVTFYKHSSIACVLHVEDRTMEKVNRVKSVGWTYGMNRHLVSHKCDELNQQLSLGREV